jgi:hypothetical protein
MKSIIVRLEARENGKRIIEDFCLFIPNDCQDAFYTVKRAIDAERNGTSISDNDRSRARQYIVALKEQAELNFKHKALGWRIMFEQEPVQDNPLLDLIQSGKINAVLDLT